MSTISRLILLAVAVALLAACGGASPITPPPPTAAPTVLAEPTLTADERQVVATWTARATSMIQAAHALQQLGQAIRADAAWKGQVRAQASIITGGQHTIGQTPLPSRYGPLSARAKTATDACAATVGKLPDVDALKVASVAALSGELDQCVRSLELLQLSLSSL